MPRTKEQLESDILISRSLIKSRANTLSNVGIRHKTYIKELIEECESLNNMIDELNQLDND